MKYFVIAGEASGDLHAAALIEALRKQDPQAQFAFLGGDLMSEASGEAPVIHYRDMAYMGFAEVIKHLPKIMRNFKIARKAITEYKPDRLILVDYPSFNLKMAKHAKKLGIPVTYYISPKVWAWKEYRVRTIKKVVDQMLCIFPFEVPFYAKHGYVVEFVGNPSVEEVDAKLAAAQPRDQWLAANNLPDKPIIALLPGSRQGEIRNNLPVMAAVVSQYPQYRGVVAGAPGIDPGFYAQFTDLPVVHGQTYELLKHARGGLVTSGTATLEAALAGLPQVALYRGNGKKWFYNLMKPFIKLNYVTLPNLIADAPVITELLQHFCTVDAAADALHKLLPDKQPRAEMLDAYKGIRQTLGEGSAADRAAAAILAADKH